jgi:glycerol uptake facilitator-like aquaporin
MNFSKNQKYISELIGSFFLVLTVVGSGIMADQLSQDDGITLLGNAIPTGLTLIVIISIFGPISGAHFNPIVSLVFWLKRMMSLSDFIAYVIMQISGAIFGCVIANIIFKLPPVTISTLVRHDFSQFLSEIIATFGLVLVIFLGSKVSKQNIPVLVGSYIASAYWFTSSTSFANPAVTVARQFSDTFTGISPSGVPTFITAQIFGAIFGYVVVQWLNNKVIESD